MSVAPLVFGEHVTSNVQTIRGFSSRKFGVYEGREGFPGRPWVDMGVDNSLTVWYGTVCHLILDPGTPHLQNTHSNTDVHRVH
jgi:hypothetical protein